MKLLGQLSNRHFKHVGFFFMEKHLTFICPKITAKIAAIVMFTLTAILSAIGLLFLLLMYFYLMINDTPLNIAASYSTVNLLWVEGGWMSLLIEPFLCGLFTFIITYVLCWCYNWLAPKFGYIKILLK